MRLARQGSGCAVDVLLWLAHYTGIRRFVLRSRLSVLRDDGLIEPSRSIGYASIDDALTAVTDHVRHHHQA